jgi:putative tryptophan/tyrosine transport system substrate-binding protein
MFGPLAWGQTGGDAQRRSVRIGVLSSAEKRLTGRSVYEDLFSELATKGWVEGRNLAIDWRYAAGSLPLHDSFAAEIVALKPDLIIATTQIAAVAVMKATQSIPIVFVTVPEPVESGLAESLARPGKNATGLASMNKELIVKRIELLREAIPSAKRIGILLQPEIAMNVRQAEVAERAAAALGLATVRVGIGALPTYASAIQALRRERVDAVVVVENPSAFTNRSELVRRIGTAKLPAIYGYQEFSLVGGLLTYAINFPEQYRRAADYVDRILHGAKPGDLPVQQPVRFELTVNRKAATEIGIAIPQSILLRADRVIE